MLKEKKHILYVITIFILAPVVNAKTIDVQFQSNKTEYICGEPVLLKTSIFNSSGKDLTDHGYAWSPEFGFTMYVAYGKEDFNNILNAKTIIRLNISTPPLQYEFFTDRHCLRGNLSAGTRATRVDMLIFPKPGDYKLKAVLKDPNGQVHESIPIQIRLLPLSEKYDSISQLGEQDFLINLGSSINYAHYIGQIWGGYSPGKSLNAKEFKKLAPIIIEKHKDSVFREYVMYADIMAPGEIETPTQIESCRTSAERFIKEYPKSWFLPDVYLMLFTSYVRQRDREKAEQIRTTVLQIAPDASVLNLAKKVDLSKLNPKK